MCKRSKNPNLIHCPKCGGTIAEKCNEPGALKIHCKYCKTPLKVKVDSNLNVTVQVLSE